jgi:UDP-N-acetylglucosamine transferase subunit ALG13
LSAAPERSITADVLVTVGTDHHPFDRLIRWVDSWAYAHPMHPCLVQRGTSIRPATCDSHEYVAYDDLVESMFASTVIVSHGGPATIMEARAYGRLPIVVPRRPDLGEHVDDHQIRFSRWMAGRDQVVLAETEEELHRHLDLAFANPIMTRIDPADPEIEASVRRFGTLVDGLLDRRNRR